MTANDLDLLRQFTRDQSQDAFTALVNRHVKLVYSAALRQIRSPQLAEDVSQSVFADLARDAGKLSGTGFQPVHFLTAWLYQVTRRTAIDVIRKESRRQLREQIAVEMNNMNATANDWTQIEPLLDDAMDALDETDRSAILLRYFENKTLREVGEALGTSDDAAQKRVSRAVEQLREFFSKRNVTIGASGLIVLISANAIQAAPIGLAATISAAAILAGTAVHTSTIIAATKTIAMTTLQKTLVTATVAIVAGAGIYEARQAAQLREQNQTLQQRQAEQIQQLVHERNDATNRLAGKAEEIAKIKDNNRELLRLRGEVGQMRNLIGDSQKLREENIQLRALSVKANLALQAPVNDPGLESRQQSPRIAQILSNVVLRYASENQGRLPAGFDEAAQLFKDAMQTDPFLRDESELIEKAKQFEITRQGSLDGLTNGANTILLRERTAQQRPDGHYERAYSFADGHGEVWITPDGNYAEREAARPTFNSSNTRLRPNGTAIRQPNQ
jgi:RNA polymerase sigma factor (sigma-70 family)